MFYPQCKAFLQIYTTLGPQLGNYPLVFGSYTYVEYEWLCVVLKKRRFH